MSKYLTIFFFAMSVVFADLSIGLTHQAKAYDLDKLPDELCSPSANYCRKPDHSNRTLIRVTASACSGKCIKTKDACIAKCLNFPGPGVQDCKNNCINEKRSCMRKCKK